MSGRIRLIATDLDGTLLRDDGTISNRTREALRRAHTAGLHLVLATARPPRFLRRLARDSGVSALAICCNGALVYDLAGDCIVRHTPLNSEVAHSLITGLREAMPGICFAFEMGDQYGWEPAYATLAGAMVEPGGLLGDALAFAVKPITKLIVRHSRFTADTLLPFVRDRVGTEAYVTHSGVSFVEVSATSAQKALALEALCAELNVVADEVLAFGDMPNDLPLLKWAGCGVAVANAHPDVLAIADEVTLSNEEDGVAVMLERLLPL